MKNEIYLLDRLNQIKSTSQQKVDSLNNKFNTMKNELQKMTDYFNIKNQYNNFLNDQVQYYTLNLKEIEKQIKIFLGNERKVFIEIIIYFIY